MDSVNETIPLALTEGDNGRSSAGHEGSCPTCSGRIDPMPMPFIYSLGRIEARFPTVSVEKEFMQVASRAQTSGKTDRQVFQTVLSMPENRYLIRQLCWVLSIQGMDTYVLQPRNPMDYELLLGSIRPVPNPSDIDVVVGMRGPIAPPQMCNGLMLPIIAFDQIYSFDRDALIKAIPRPDTISKEAFGPAAEEVFDRLLRITDNVGAKDEHRALNYLAVRDPSIYARAAEEFAHDYSLSLVQVQPSPLTVSRKIVDVIFSYTNRTTDFTEKFSVGVDVTEEFPFLVTKLSPYYSR